MLESSNLLNVNLPSLAPNAVPFMYALVSCASVPKTACPPCNAVHVFHEFIVLFTD